MACDAYRHLYRARKSRNFHNVWSYKYNKGRGLGRRGPKPPRWLYATTFTITDLRVVLPVSAKPSFAVILRRYRQSPYSRLYKFSVTSRAAYGYSRGQRNGSAIFPSRVQRTPNENLYPRGYWKIQRTRE